MKTVEVEDGRPCEHDWAEWLGRIGGEDGDPLFYCLTCDSYWTEDKKEWRIAL